ncbi:MAG TPA: CdvA-like protein [Nitrososphaeraceae archaeon]|jgi:CdvA-like protein|nr:CdvA-like protein [Nitrososphaeraceae archaeon]
MSELKLEFVGKQVKDMYGTLMGNVVGIITDTDGSIECVSVDCGNSGLKQLSYEQLLVQGDYVIFIPKWRLDAQKLFRQKNLTLKRIKALQHLVEEDDTMKEDAEIVYVKYEKKLDELEEKEKSINEKLKERLDELNRSTKDIKSILFDAKLQYKSHEIPEETYLQVTRYTKELMDHISLEKEEINNIKGRLEEQNLENTLPLPHSIQSEEEEEKENSKIYTNTNSINPTITNTPNTTTTVTASNTNNSNSSNESLSVSSTSDNIQTKPSYSTETEKYKQHIPSNNADLYSKSTKDEIEKSTTDNEANWLDQVINN